MDERARTLAPRTAAEYRRNITADVEKHRLRKMRAVDLTPLDLNSRLTEMATAGAPVGANRVHPAPWAPAPNE